MMWNISETYKYVLYYNKCQIVTPFIPMAAQIGLPAEGQEAWDYYNSRTQAIEVLQDDLIHRIYFPVYDMVSVN